MVAAAQWNIKDTPDSKVKEQEIWGIKGGAGKEFQLYYLVLSSEFLVSLRSGRKSHPQATCKVSK
jgi:hypothetical protein